VCCDSSSNPIEEITFWSVTGQKLATYQLVSTPGQMVPTTIPPVLSANQTGTNYYFGSKLIKNAGGYVGADRLGSIGHFYPYGQEKPSATQNGTEKFTGYMRDAETGLDYADQRYHAPGTGRFLTPDQYTAKGGGSGNLEDPGNWNRYAYAGGDPINHRDPFGQDWCWVDDFPESCLIAETSSDPGGMITFAMDQLAIALAGLTTLGEDIASEMAAECPTYASPTGVFYSCFHQSGNDWNQLTKDLKTIDNKLHKDKDCMNFLTSAGVSMSQIDNDLLNPTSTFTLADQIIRFQGDQSLAGTTNDPVVPTSIAINSSLYMSSNQPTNFLTIIHELSHLVNVIPQDGDPPSSKKNDNTIFDHCSKTIGFKGQIQ